MALAADRIRLGEADVMIAAGTESMSMVPMMGNKIAMNPAIFTHDENIAIAYGMGLTAEKVAERQGPWMQTGYWIFRINAPKQKQHSFLNNGAAPIKRKQEEP